MQIKLINYFLCFSKLKGYKTTLEMEVDFRHLDDDKDKKLQTYCKISIKGYINNKYKKNDYLLFNKEIIYSEIKELINKYYGIEKKPYFRAIIKIDYITQRLGFVGKYWSGKQYLLNMAEDKQIATELLNKYL